MEEQRPPQGGASRLLEAPHPLPPSGADADPRRLERGAVAPQLPRRGLRLPTQRGGKIVLIIC